MKKLTSLQLHLNHPAEQVVETRYLEDVGCGIYPCYYLKCENKLKVSTSATSLIFNSSAFELNTKFKPPAFSNRIHNSDLSRSFYTRLIKIYKNAIEKIFPDLKEAGWYPTWETIDFRVKKLKPFERVTPDNSIITFRPDFTITNKELIVNRTVHHMKTFINAIEKDFPDFDHVVMTGGKDSQLINLVPKLNSEKWHIFSAEPNYALVKKWVEKNNVNVNGIFRHDNINEETSEDLRRKIICGDLYGDPAHMRWVVSLNGIAKKFDNKCIFWNGTAADAIYSFHEDFHNKSKDDYFKLHMIRVSSWQGNYHQIFKNFVGCPLLSPYHSKEIWEKLYKHIDPSIITKDIDLRIKIGEKLFGGPIKWLSKNPGTEPYIYNFHFDSYKFYVQYIRKGLAGKCRKGF